MDMTSVFAEITKSTPQDDGSILVYGKATGSDLDLDQQRCDPEWLRTAMPEWLKIGNIREQHDSKRAVGKAFEHEVTDDGSHMIRARVVDPIAKAKVQAGILTGFSIGIRSPQISKTADAKNGTIVGGQVVEVSLVDRPCLPTATLMMCKAAKPGMQVNSGDFDSERLLVRCEEYLEKAVDPENADEMTVTLAEQLPPEQVEALVEKTTDVENLEAPAPGQVCAVCGEDGHLVCGEKATDLEVPAEDVEKTPEVEAEKTADAAEFDVDQAKALVAAVVGKEGADLAHAVGEVLKADAPAGADVPPAYNDEQSDILNAQAAIAIIGKLIISEASELVDNPAEACDIQILLSAIGALRCFIGREQQQSLGENEVDDCDSDMIVLTAGADTEKAETVAKAKYSAEQLRSMLADGKAMKNPDGEPSYPIGDVADLENAIHAVGRGKGDHDAIRAYIEGRAKALGKSDLIPDSWSDSGKAADPELVEALTELADAVIEKADEATKAVEPEAIKAAVFDEDAMFKSLSGDLEKADSPLHKLFKSFVETQAAVLVEALAKSTAEAHGELCAQVEQVKSMATPNGPQLRRTDAEIKSSRKQDLELMADAEERKALAPDLDRDVREGYLRKAAGFRAQAHAI